MLRVTDELVEYCKNKKGLNFNSLDELMATQGSGSPKNLRAFGYVDQKYWLREGGCVYPLPRTEPSASLVAAQDSNSSSRSLSSVEGSQNGGGVEYDNLSS